MWKEFVFVCWWCDDDCVIAGEQTGFWGTQYTVDAEWYCHNCGALNETPDGPWTEAA